MSTITVRVRMSIRGRCTNLDKLWVYVFPGPPGVAESLPLIVNLSGATPVKEAVYIAAPAKTSSACFDYNYTINSTSFVAIARETHDGRGSVVLPIAAAVPTRNSNPIAFLADGRVLRVHATCWPHLGHLQLRGQVRYACQIH